VYQRQDGRWVAQLNDESGHRVAFYAATRDEAEDRLTDARHRNRQGLKLTHGRQTLDAYLRGWLERKRSHVRVSTWSTYRGHLGRYVLGKPIGNVQLVDFRAEHLATLYRDLEGSVSPQTVRHVATILRQALKAAVDAGEIARNPADTIKTARVSRAVMVTLTPKQVEALLREANSDELEALWVLAVTTGMRLGELLGLPWRSVDSKHKHLSVETSLSGDSG
jgi:integrase